MSFFAGGVTYESGSGDYAEWLERANHDETITIGDVVGVVGGKITKNTEGASQLMVASFKPCVLGNMPEEGKEPYFNKVAFMGQVPVKMMTPVRKGDYIIPDGRNNGFAKAIAPEDITSDDLDKVLGVSWQDDLQYGVKFVNIAVGLKPHEMVKVIQDQQKELDDLKAQIAEIRSEITSVHVTSHSKKSAKRSKELSAN
jgi:translation elongation factor EF-1beta